MLVLSSILHLGKSGLPAKPITEDDFDRIAACLKVLAEQSGETAAVVEPIYLDDCRRALQDMIEAQGDTADELLTKGNKKKADDALKAKVEAEKKPVAAKKAAEKALADAKAAATKADAAKKAADAEADELSKKK